MHHRTNVSSDARRQAAWQATRFGGRQDEAEDDDSDVDSESEYTSSDVDADDESEGDDQQEKTWQAIPSELIPDRAPPGGKQKVVQSEA